MPGADWRHPEDPMSPTHGRSQRSNRQNLFGRTLTGDYWGCEAHHAVRRNDVLYMNRKDQRVETALDVAIHLGALAKGAKMLGRSMGRWASDLRPPT